MDTLVYKDEKYWASRAKASWLQVGDKNTSFFHKSASARRQNNVIKGVLNESNVWLSADADIENEFVRYFDNLFTSNECREEDLGKIFSHVPLKLSDSMNDQLLRPFLPADVKEALFSMNPNKSPGKDGLGAGFF